MSDPLSGFAGAKPKLHFLEWKGTASGTIVLVHGNSANAWWWRWTAEAMPRSRPRMIAIDLRGHGDSEWVRPPAYSPQHYGEDIATLIRELNLERPLIVGHSMGGIASIAFAQKHADMTRGIIAIDVAVTSSTRRNRYLRHLQALPTVIYPDLATAKAKYRLMPRDGAIAARVLAELAERSLVKTETGGYTMKFDRESFFGSDGLDVAMAIRQIKVPLLLVRAGMSRIMTAEAAAAAVESNSRVRLITITGAHHHLPLERPLELACEISKWAG
jgi:esterase